jgi:hypothetical protein
MAPCLWKIKKVGLQGSVQGLSADLIEAARRRNLSANSHAAYERTWTRFLAWAAAAGFDPRSLPFPIALDAYRFLGEGKNAASLNGALGARLCRQIP